MSKDLDNITTEQKLGQFFSPNKLVNKCISLIRNKDGRILEPSCGDGAFKKLFNKNAVFIELDAKIAMDGAKVMDFFDYPVSEKFDTIIGNPPYVDNSLFNVHWKTEIPVSANLYLYFIEKSFWHLKDGGEIIFIVPREFIKLTSARYVNSLLYSHGTITDYYDYGDEKLFNGVSPNVCIFRYEKGNMSHKTKTNDGTFNEINNDGLISFVKDNDYTRLGDIFEVKVGAVSGADKLFVNDSGVSFVYSKTRQTGGLKKMIYNKHDKSLDKYKDILINRKIKKFDEKNWFTWGRPVDFRIGQKRLYVNCKTRVENPFFTSKCDRWDGSVLALFPKIDMDLDIAVDNLNSINWQELGLKSGGRFMFSQKSLTEVPVQWKKF